MAYRGSQPFMQQQMQQQQMQQQQMQQQQTQQPGHVTNNSQFPQPGPISSQPQQPGPLQEQQQQNSPLHPFSPSLQSPRSTSTGDRQTPGTRPPSVALQPPTKAENVSNSSSLVNI